MVNKKKTKMKKPKKFYRCFVRVEKKTYFKDDKSAWEINSRYDDVETDCKTLHKIVKLLKEANNK